MRSGGLSEDRSRTHERLRPRVERVAALTEERCDLAGFERVSNRSLRYAYYRKESSRPCPILRGRCCRETSITVSREYFSRLVLETANCRWFRPILLSPE